MANTILTEREERICLERINNAMKETNAKNKMIVKVAPPMKDKWGFSFTPVNGDKQILLIGKYQKVNNNHIIEWKSNDSKLTTAFHKKVEKYVSMLIFKSMNIL